MTQCCFDSEAQTDRAATVNIEVVMVEGKRMWSNTHWPPKLPPGNATHHFFPYFIGQCESDILA